MLTVHAIGDWSDGAVRSSMTTSTRAVVPSVEAMIDQTWSEACAKPGVHLFDGPMCRLERWSAKPERLDLAFSLTNYRTFFGTNVSHADLADRFGSDVLANSLGLSVLVSTADAMLLLGRRSGSVAGHAGQVHPFAGTLEARDADDVFVGARRELAEELSLHSDGIKRLRCIGLIEDHRLRQPELVFHADSTRSANELSSTLDPLEHRDVYRVFSNPPDIGQALADPALTPVAIGALLLWGRESLGERWYLDERAHRGVR